MFALRDIAKYTKAEIIQKALPTRADLVAKKTQQLHDAVAQACAEQPSSRAEELLNRLTEEGYTAQQIAQVLLEEKLSASLQSIPEFDAPQPIRREGKRGRSDVTTAKVDINIGRQQRIAPNFILGALVDATGLSGKDFGKIDIFDQHTTVEVPEAEMDFVIDSLNAGKINGHKVTVKRYEGKETGSRSDFRGKSRNDGFNRRPPGRNTDPRNEHKKQSRRFYG